MDATPNITIHIDEDVLDALKAEAEPFTDSPNSVLRRKFGLAPVQGTESAEPARDASTSARRTRRRRRSGSSNGKPRNSRAPRGSLLPEEAYEIPILAVLHRHGGRAPTREVIEEVGALVRDRLTPLDHEELATGGFRWQKRVQFTRLRLVERGLVKKDSPRGVWEITDAGGDALAEHIRDQLDSATEQS